MRASASTLRRSRRGASEERQQIEDRLAAASLDVIEEALQGRRGVPRFRPPDLRGVLVRTRGPGHASSVGARAPGESGSGY